MFQAFHQSQATLPGFIQEVSAMRGGLPSKYDRSEVARVLSSPITMIRQGKERAPLESAI